MLKYASIIFEVLAEKRVGEAGFRNGLDNCHLRLSDCKTSAYVLSTGIFCHENFFSVIPSV